MYKLITEDGRHRQHRRWLRNLLETTNGPLRIASAYVTDTDLLVSVSNRSVQILTSLLRMDVVSGATSLDALRSLIENGVQCRYLSNGPRFHAKVYIFGDEFVVVTSANLTRNALDSNIEVGVELSGNAVQEVIAWFDVHWDKAQPLDATQVSMWQQQTATLCSEYSILRKKLSAEPKLSHNALPVGLPQDGSSLLHDILDNTNSSSQSRPRFFLCNTDRKHGRPTHSGKYKREELMCTRSYAAAWEKFKFPNHMKRVKSGDVIFMYANKVGIIGIGVAKKGYEVLEPGHIDRILNEEEITPEWRIPVAWLVWVSDEQASPWQPPDVRTFVDVSEQLYDDRRDRAIKHFESQTYKT
ncbi:MAG: phospholipase D family protein [Thermoguttaceae bacterium]